MSASGEVGGQQVQGCEACGNGFSPDERMTFTGMTSDEILKAAYAMITEAQLKLSSAECCLAKLIEVNKGGGSFE